MKHIPAGEFGKALFPSGSKGGRIAVLSAYFDDSGTDAGSPVVVWGGVVGPEQYFERFESAWGEMLAEPLPGKPRLRKFSLGDCRWAEGEFANYKPAERDALRYRTREIIRDSKLDAIAYGIPKQLYNTILRGRARRDYGDPSGVAFAACADLAIQVSDRFDKVPLACIFDEGQDQLDPTLRLFIADAKRRAAKADIPVSYGFAPVVATYGLQAADTIATEHYWHGLECLKSEIPEAKPHFWSLMNMVEPIGWTLGAAEITKMRDDYYKMHPIRNWLRRNVGYRS